MSKVNLKSMVEKSNAAKKKLNSKTFLCLVPAAWSNQPICNFEGSVNYIIVFTAVLLGLMVYVYAKMKIKHLKTNLDK